MLITRNLKKLLKRFSAFPRRLMYFTLALLIAISGIVWWRPHHAAAQTIFLTDTAATTWAVPSDWNSSSNTVEVIGGGGGGHPGIQNQGGGGSGGIGGDYAKTNNVTLTPGTNVGISVGTGGTNGNNGGATWFCNSTANCSNLIGTNGASVVAGAGSGTQIGDVGYAGGGGGNGDFTNGGGGGGGGAAGPNGAGVAGSSANSSNGANGGQGDNFSGGSSGVGGTGGSSGGSPGGNGSEWDAAHGSGGGGGGGGAGTGNRQAGFNGADGGSYGAGGGGGGEGGRNDTAGSAGGNGYQGIIVIIYTPVPQTYTQSSYGFYSNLNQSDPPGSALAAQNTSVTLSSTGQAFRLRQLIRPSLLASSGSQTFNEQFADLNTYGNCSAIPSNNWNNVSGGPSSYGPIFAGTGSNDASVGTIAWTNTGNITADDGATANIPFTSGTTNYLTATNYGFSIPSGSTINGITAEIKEVNGEFGGITKDNAVRIIKGGVIQSSNKANTNIWPAGVYVSYGGTSDLWGASWSAADINSSGFGLAISAFLSSSDNPSIDAIRITVNYTPPNIISYNDNASATNGDSISYHAGTDPTDSGNYTAQTYQEADGFGIANDIAANTDGIWDLSLKDNGAPASTTYCFRTVKSDGTPLDTYSQYPMLTTATGNVPPISPSLSAPASGAANIDVLPDFTLSSTDADSDHLKYKIVLYDSDCASAPPPYGTVQTFDQTSDQTNWTGQDQDSGTTYASGSPATFSLTGTPLSFSHTYCWKGAAIDPLGSAAFSSYSATQTFTTGAIVNHPVNINGNVNIYGNTNIY